MLPLSVKKKCRCRSCVIMMRSVIILIKSDQSGDSNSKHVKRVPFFNSLVWGKPESTIIIKVLSLLILNEQV